MTAHCAPEPRLSPLYFVEVIGQRTGASYFGEVDRDDNSLSAIVDAIISGEVDPIKILMIDEAAGTCVDVTDDIMSTITPPGAGEKLTGQDLIDWRRDHLRELRTKG
jgi:hypothetical protein